MPEISLKFIGNDFEKNRIGFLVSAKSFKKAVDRNKIKRRMKEALRVVLRKVEILPGGDIVLIARSGIKEKDFGEVKEMIYFLFKKAGLTR